MTKQTLQTIPVRSPGRSYADYTIAFVEEKGNTVGILSLTQFSKKMRSGKRVKTGNFSFVGINSI